MPCVPDPESYAEDSSCPEFLTHKEEIAAAWGLASTPEGPWPQIFDSRVDAAVATSPDVDVYGTENAGLASVEIPTMVMAQSSDDLFSLERVISVYEHLASTEKALVEFENAGHTIFMNPCEVTPWFPEFTSPWVCSDAVWDVQRAHDLINHFTTMFLLAELYGDADTSAALSPEEVEFSGMDYQAGGSARSLVASADAPVRVWGAQDDPARDRRPDPMGEPRRFS